MDYIEINKRLWNQKTEIHYNSDFYDVDSFRHGKDSLNQERKRDFTPAMPFWIGYNFTCETWSNINRC